ncbi:hypothetical protein [Mycobacterium tilburgii]|uniref:hypothetical protein n=1 Tax=Mycobacterium tilburgii TaxID=44467 RepID=UPI0016433530|nr:hypothetical protein [Mycobacterium tilburgii]
MPNRRRRKLSTTMSAVAALAMASPCAYCLVYESTAGSSKPVEHHEFKQAAVMADLPGELMGALSQGLSSFGINLPPVPALSGTGTGLTSPGLGSPGLGTTGLGTPGLTNPGLTSPGLTPGATGLTPGATGLTSPAGLTPGVGTPGEVPISAPLDPGVDGTYPILGDPSTLGGTSPIGGGSSNGGGGLVNDVMQAANQLGAGQAIDLLKGLVMPAIAQAQQGSAALPGAPAALPHAAGALPAAGRAALPPALPPV